MSNKDNVFFNMCKQLYSSYNLLKQTSELYNCLLENFHNYSIDTSSIKIENTRKIFNENILKYYPNEIAIKSSFINNILFKTNNHVTIFELNSGTSRVDLCKINGKSVAYEIKTDLDNFNRLDKQISDYLNIFENVYVICSKNNVNKIINRIPKECGIYSYRITSSGRYIFKKEKKSISSSCINAKKQLSLFTKQDLTKYFGTELFSNKDSIISNILHTYDSKTINELFKKNFKSKYKANWDFLFMNHSNILEIDYQWFFKNNINPNLIYKKSAT